MEAGVCIIRGKWRNTKFDESFRGSFIENAGVFDAAELVTLGLMFANDNAPSKVEI